MITDNKHNHIVGKPNCMKFNFNYYHGYINLSTHLHVGFIKLSISVMEYNMNIQQRTLLYTCILC